MAFKGPFTWKRVGGTCFFARWLCTWSTAFLEKDCNKEKETQESHKRKCRATSSFSFLYRGMSPRGTWAGLFRCFETTAGENTSLITSSLRTAASINFVRHLKLLPSMGTKAALWRVVCCDPLQAVSHGQSKPNYYFSLANVCLIL